MFNSFRDIFSGEVAPLIFEFGHIMESPSSWEQRFEKRDINAQRHQGKVSIKDSTLVLCTIAYGYIKL